jgi:hypothetical protein
MGKAAKSVMAQIDCHALGTHGDPGHKKPDDAGAIGGE